MTRLDRDVLPIAGLVASLLVFTWPQLSARFHGASAWYPLVTVVFSFLIIGIVVTWPRGGQSPAPGRNPLTIGALAVMVTAAVVVVVAACRWTRILAWQPYQADMLIVIREATR